MNVFKGFKVFMPPHLLYTVGAVCLFVFVFLNTGKKKQMWFSIKRRPCVLLNISSVAISAGLPVAVKSCSAK